MVGGKYCDNLSQNFTSPALTVWDRQCLIDSEQKDHESVNELITKVFIEHQVLMLVVQL